MFVAWSGLLSWVQITDVVRSLYTEVTSTPTRPVDNVVIATKGLQDRNTNIIAGTTVENKGKLILTEIFPSVQKHDIFLVLIISYIYSLIIINEQWDYIANQILIMPE